jgi:4-hydroxy-2-oxoheptanedioate aldolase
VGALPAEVNDAVTVLAMIETAEGLANVEAIAGTPGLDGLYIGPTDLTLGLGGAAFGDSSVADAFESALARVRRACEDRGIAAGLHTLSGEQAAKRISEGFTFVSVAGDLSHLEAAARSQLAVARGRRAAP